MSVLLQVESLLVRLVCEGQTPETVEEVVHAITATGWDTSTTYTMAITRLTQAIR